MVKQVFLWEVSEIKNNYLSGKLFCKTFLGYNPISKYKATFSWIISQNKTKYQQTTPYYGDAC